MMDWRVSSRSATRPIKITKIIYYAVSVQINRLCFLFVFLNCKFFFLFFCFLFFFPRIVCIYIYVFVMMYVKNVRNCRLFHIFLKVNLLNFFKNRENKVKSTILASVSSFNFPYFISTMRLKNNNQ